MANQWFRLYAEFATDPKVQMMSEADQRRFIMVLCLRCSNDDVTLRDDEVAFQLRISNDEWARSKLLFLQKGLINDDNTPTAWERRQFISDSSAERVRRHRAKKKNGEKQPCNVTETPPEAETETETEKPSPSSPTAQARETGPPTAGCSQMRSDWAPSPTFATLAHQAGLPIPGNAEFESARVEFVAYWLTRPDQRTQNEWDHAFIRSLKNDRIRAQSAPQHEVRHGKSRRRTAAEQRADTIAALTGRSREGGCDDADARTIAGEARVVD